MGLFGKLFGGDGLRLDASLGDAELAAARQELAGGRFEPARRLMQKAGSPHRRDFCANVLRSAERPVFDAWLDAHPQEADAFIMNGFSAVHWAWEARGDGLGSTVSDEAAEMFFQRLDLAERRLARAAELAADDPLPRSMAIVIDKALDHPLDVSQGHFAAATARCRDHWGAHASMLDRLCEKWGGSHEAMFEFARSAAGKTAGHLRGLIAMAHVERWLYAAIEDDAKTMAEYFTTPQVRRAVVEAFGGLTRAPRSPQTIYAANSFAFCFDQMKDREHARQAFAYLADAVCESPWHYLGDAVKGFRRARKAAGA